MKKIAVGLICALLAVLTAVASDQPRAAAQQCGAVADAATLASCITSTNAIPGATIRLAADITLTTDLPAINNPGLGGTFLIGNGYTIDADEAALNVITVSGGSLVVSSVGLTGAAEHGIHATGDTSLVIGTSTVHDNLLDGIKTADDTSLRVTNSTIVENSNDGIEAGGSGDVTITLTTIAGNGRGLGDPSAASGSRWTVVDSVVAGNGADDCAVNPDLSLTDTTGSLFGDDTCTGTATADLVASLGPLQDNGCSPALSKCLPTMAIDPSSPALDAAGSCDEDKDQRLFDRTAGLCDAGAYEAGDCDSVQHSVTDEVELTFAIECFNAQKPAGDHQITLDFSFGISEELPPVSAANRRLTILGNDKFLFPDSALPSDGVLFAIDAGTLAVQDVYVDSGDTARFDRAFEVSGGALELTDSAVERVGQAVFVLGGIAEVRNAAFSQMSVGVQVENGARAVVSASSIEDTETGIFVEGAGTAVVYNTTVISGGDVGIGARGASATAYVSLSTLFRNGVGLSVENGASMFARAALVAESDTSACSGAVTSDSFNFADDDTCAGFNTLTGPIGVNQTGQCTDPTPAGCVRIVPLEAGSNAVNGGVCSLITTFVRSDDSLELQTITSDVRGVGFPRPVGSTCDAGSFELQSLPLCDGKAVTIYWSPVAVATEGNDVIMGTGGDDEIDALGGDDTVCAGEGNDVIIGGDGDDRLFGEGGNDIARGNTGEDYVDGGPGNDRLLGGIGNDELIGRDGNDYLGGFGGDDLISGGPGDETIFGGFGADRISGDAGNDTIRGLIGNDSIDGGPGNDVLDGDRGSDSIVGGTGADIIRGGNAGDVLKGEGGNDSVSGGRGDDSLSGGFGTDVCVGNDQFVADTTDGSCETVFGVP